MPSHAAVTGFDLFVLLVVGFGAAGGLMRGFVQEVLSLAAWAASIVAIAMFHADLSRWLEGMEWSASGAAVLAFVILLVVPYAVIKMLASHAGSRSRRSVLAPFDRVLGLAFGALKGVLIVIVGFSLLVLAYDTIWGVDGRPDWLRDARSYAFINASSQEMVKIIDEQRELLMDDEAASHEASHAG